MFAAILGTTSTPEGPAPGNDLLGNFHVQTTDTDDVCGDGKTLAYTNGQGTDNPYIVLMSECIQEKGRSSCERRT